MLVGSVASARKRCRSPFIPVFSRALIAVIDSLAMTNMNELIMKTDRRGRLRYTADQKQDLMEAQGASGFVPLVSRDPEASFGSPEESGTSLKRAGDQIGQSREAMRMTW